MNSSTHRAPFISFEGGDGAGKTTQIKALEKTLREIGQSVLVTREPGGSKGGEAIRALLVTGDVESWTPISETLMMYAARAEHLALTINPARENGVIVLCDRFSDSTRAYQGAGGNVSPSFIETLENGVVAGDGPDITFILDLPVERGLARAGERAEGEDRFEAKGTAFHERVRHRFLAIAAANPDRCKVIDAHRTPEEVTEEVLALALPFIESWKRKNG